MKLGKLPARPNAVLFKLKQYAALPEPPKSFGHHALIKDWGMLGNDQYGDCVLAGAGHETMLWNKTAGKDVNIGNTEALLAYHDVTGFNKNDPSTDQGTDMQAAASWRRKTGILDTNSKRHKVAAYLSISVGDVKELKQATYIFGIVGLGIQFPSSAMDQFDEGKTWTIKNSPIEGGHYVPIVGYDSRYVYVITWGKVQKATWGFIKKYMDEAVVYVSKEMLNGDKSIDGFAYKTLQDDLNNLK